MGKKILPSFPRFHLWRNEMKKRFSNKLLLFAVLIAIGIFSIIGLNQFINHSNKEALIATEDIDVLHVQENEDNENIIAEDEVLETSQTEQQPSVQKEVKEKKTEDIKTEIKEEVQTDNKNENQENHVKQKQELPKISKEVEQSNSKKNDDSKTTTSLNTEVQGETIAQEKPKYTVRITIVGPKDVGTILNTTTIEINDSKTILEILQRATKERRIHMEYRGLNATAYVEGIHNIYEFDRGPESGWMYSVNGVFPNVSAGVFQVNPGDDIRWLYTEDLGRDLGASR